VKRRDWLVLMMVLLGTLPVGAVSLCDYRSPETSLTELSMLMSYRYFDDGATPAVDVNSGRVEVNFSRLFDSPAFGCSLSGLMKLSLSDYVPSDLLAQGAGAARYYPDGTSPWYAFAGAEGSTSLTAMGLEVRGGIGHGRFTDVTPMAKAILIGEELLALGVLDSKPSEEMLTSIAEAIGRRIEYAELRDLVADIEAAIETPTGADLGAEALLRIEEIVERSGDTRKCGWTVQGGVGYELIDPAGGECNLLIAFSTDAAWSTGPRDQLVMHAGASGPFRLIEENTLNMNAQYELDVSEDVEISVSCALRRNDPREGPVTSDWSLSAGMTYDLGGADLAVQVSLNREAADPRSTVELSLSASVDLL